MRTDMAMTTYSVALTENCLLFDFHSGPYHENIGVSPLSNVLSSYDATGTSDWSRCMFYQSHIPWERPQSTNDAQVSQFDRFNKWIEQAKQELPGVAKNNFR